MPEGQFRSSGQLSLNQDIRREYVRVLQSQSFTIRLRKKSPFPNARIEIAKWVTPSCSAKDVAKAISVSRCSMHQC